MPRKRQQYRKAWQRRPNSSAQFVQLFHDMVDSPAFHSLSTRAKVLYLYAVRESHGQATRDDENHDPRLFYMNKSLRCKVHELYPESDTRQFEQHMAELIAHGFVDCVRAGFKNRERNIYRLSDRWCHWGTDDFKIPDSVKTNYMLRKGANEKVEIDDTCKHAG